MTQRDRSEPVLSGPSATQHTQPGGRQLPVPSLTPRGAISTKQLRSCPQAPLFHQSDPGRVGSCLHGLLGGGWRGQAVPAGAVALGTHSSSPRLSGQGWRLQHLGLSLQPLPPVSGVPWHSQARPGVPHSRGTDEGGEGEKGTSS